ncbi:MAG: FHA domain-containing protein [Planctomycetes bacterium]|nr:FHA domain-containing protein [Planctomycetota bacterium]
MSTYTLIVELPGGPERVEVDRFPFRFGRGDASHFRIRDDSVGVSAFHAQLLLRDGRLLIEDTNSTNGTYVDGKKIGEPTELAPGMVVGLGRKGPRLRLLGAGEESARTLADSLAGAPLTAATGTVDVRERKQGVGLNTLVRYVDQARSVERRRVVGVVGGIAGMVLLLSIGAFWWLQAGTGEVSWLGEYRDRVWMVCARTDLDGRTSYRAIGTAWSYRPGQLATNAHVAETIAELRQGQRLVARVLRNGAVVELGLSEATKHPGYDQIQKAWAKYPPWLSGRVASLTGQYDVALLTVRAEDRSLQGEVLPVATAAEAATVHQGQELHYLGYPSENKNANPERPDQHYLAGTCAKLTDSWWAPAAQFQPDGLVSVQFPGAGGASGGPLFDHAGKVIGLLAAGDVTRSGDGGRSSEGIIHGPNVALLREIDGSTVPGDGQRAIEARMRELYRKGLDGELLVDDLTAACERDLGEHGIALVRDSRQDTTIETTLDAGGHWDYTVRLPDGVAVALIVVVPKDEPLWLRLVSESKDDEALHAYRLPYAPALQLLPKGPRPREVRLIAAKDSPTSRAGVKIYVRTFALAKK